MYHKPIEVKCKFESCRIPCESTDEIDMELCARHLDHLTNRYHFALICWTCNSMINTIYKHQAIQGAYVQDKYVFAKDCPKCNHSRSYDSLQYVTVKSGDIIGPEPMVITPEGKLLITEKSITQDQVGEKYATK